MIYDLVKSVNSFMWDFAPLFLLVGTFVVLAMTGVATKLLKEFEELNEKNGK